MSILLKLPRKILREIFLKKRNPVRYVLERKIFPNLKDKKILYVGVAPYTKDYPRKLRRNDLTTIDINPYVAKYGAKKHVIGDIVNFKSKAEFDIIFLIGIFGFGVDMMKKADKVLKKCYNLLKTNGILIVSQELAEGHNTIKLRELKSYGLFQAIEAFGYNSPSKFNTCLLEFLLKTQKS